MRETAQPATRVFIEDIKRHVATFYGLRPMDLDSQVRMRSIARPRQVAMYLARQLTLRSLPEIGRLFGGRDHSTIAHGVEVIAHIRKHDIKMDRDIDVIRAAITGSAK